MQTQQEFQNQEMPDAVQQEAARSSLPESAPASEAAAPDIPAEHVSAEKTVATPPIPLEQTLEEKLAEANARVAEMQDLLLRTRAELENFRRRAMEETQRAHKYAIEGFAEALVPVKDSLETALAVANPTIDSFKEGVEVTLKQLDSAFLKNKLTEINPTQGEKLDPMKHQAISIVPAKQTANSIISVLHKGYMINDRLLRPALVTVSAEKSDDEATQ